MYTTFNKLASFWSFFFSFCPSYHPQTNGDDQARFIAVLSCEPQRQPSSSSSPTLPSPPRQPPFSSSPTLPPPPRHPSLLLCSPGAEEGVRPHQVPGAFKSKGPGLRHPSEGPHRLGAHDRRALLHRAGLPAPKGHMVSAGRAPFLCRPPGIKSFQFPGGVRLKKKTPALSSSRRAPSFEFNFTCTKRAEFPGSS